MRNFTPLWVCLLLLGMLPGKGLAQVIGTWEQNTDGWIDWAGENGVSGDTQGGAGVNNGNTTLPSQYSYSTTGATLGVNSLALLLKAADSPFGSGYYQALSDKLEYNTDINGKSELADFENDQAFQISVTYNSANWIGASYANIQLIVNAPGYGFGSAISPTSDTLNPASPGGWDPTDYPGINTATLTWNYSSILAQIPANPGYVEFILKTSTNAVVGTMYFDDAQLIQVPEPASISMLAMAGLGLLRRRRFA